MPSDYHFLGLPIVVELQKSLWPWRPRWRATAESFAHMISGAARATMMMMRSRMSLNLRCSRRRRIARRAERPGDESANLDEDEGTPRGLASKAARPDDQPVPRVSHLTPELLNIVLQWLSPEDLTQVSETCRALRGPAMEDSLWRRCYCARFGHPKQREREREKRGESRSGGARGSGVGLGGSGGGPGRGSSWRAMYYLDDAREMRQRDERGGRHAGPLPTDATRQEKRTA